MNAVHSDPRNVSVCRLKAVSLLSELMFQLIRQSAVQTTVDLFEIDLRLLGTSNGIAANITGFRFGTMNEGLKRAVFEVRWKGERRVTMCSLIDGW